MERFAEFVGLVQYSYHESGLAHPEPNPPTPRFDSSMFKSDLVPRKVRVRSWSLNGLPITIQCLDAIQDPEPMGDVTLPICAHEWTVPSAASILIGCFHCSGPYVSLYPVTSNWGPILCSPFKPYNGVFCMLRGGA